MKTVSLSKQKVITCNKPVSKRQGHRGSSLPTDMLQAHLGRLPCLLFH